MRVTRPWQMLLIYGCFNRDGRKSNFALFSSLINMHQASPPADRAPQVEYRSCASRNERIEIIRFSKTVNIAATL
jgi:hypothetical protein